MSWSWSPFKNNRWGVPPIPNPITGGGRVQPQASVAKPPEWQALAAHADEVGRAVHAQARWSASVGFELAPFKGRAPKQTIVDALHAPGGATPTSPGVWPLIDAHRQAPGTRFELWVHGPRSGDPDKVSRGARWTYVDALTLDQIQKYPAKELGKQAAASAKKKVG